MRLNLALPMPVRVPLPIYARFQCLCLSPPVPVQVWVAVLCSHATGPESPLFPLVYPLVQIILGVARLQPVARYYPLRLLCCSLLNEISWTTDLFTPTAPLLLEALKHMAGAGKPKSSGGKPPNLNLVLKLNKSVLDSQPAQTAVVRQALDLLLDTYRTQFFSIAFPELVRTHPEGLLVVLDGVNAWCRLRAVWGR